MPKATVQLQCVYTCVYLSKQHSLADATQSKLMHVCLGMSYARSRVSPSVGAASTQWDKTLENLELLCRKQ